MSERVGPRPMRRCLDRTARGRPAHRGAGAPILAVSLALLACDPAYRIQERLRHETAHEAYAHALAAAGLASTALVRDWNAAARRSLDRPTPIDVPYGETGYFPPDVPTALGYRFQIASGQRFVAQLRFEPAGDAAQDTQPIPPRIFIDLYRLGGDSATIPFYETSADTATHRLEYAPWTGGEFVLRVQPELLRGGRYTLSIHHAASLAFPVAGGSGSDIGSVYGDPREGGRRSHKGVDIFAPRGTPALAVAPGTIRRVRTTGLGGKVVWLRDAESDQSYYYAHLDTQLVRDGMHVKIGDTLGLVGNTGNARTTPPHLHFGIYRKGRGAVDPFPFLFEPDTAPAPGRADPAMVGQWARIRTKRARIRGGPGSDAPILTELPARTALRVIAAVGDWYRIRLPDGRRGHLYAPLVEPLDRAVAERVLGAPVGLQARPIAGAPVVDSIAGDAAIPVLGRFGTFLLVRAPDGATGWLAADRVARAVRAAGADG